jgi:hypothetical protein
MTHHTHNITTPMTSFVCHRKSPVIPSFSLNGIFHALCFAFNARLCPSLICPYPPILSFSLWRYPPLAPLLTFPRREPRSLLPLPLLCRSLTLPANLTGSTAHSFSHLCHHIPRPTEAWPCRSALAAPLPPFPLSLVWSVYLLALSLISPYPIVASKM